MTIHINKAAREIQKQQLQILKQFRCKQFFKNNFIRTQYRQLYLSLITQKNVLQNKYKKNIPKQKFYSDVKKTG